MFIRSKPTFNFKFFIPPFKIKNQVDGSEKTGLKNVAGTSLSIDLSFYFSSQKAGKWHSKISKQARQCTVDVEVSFSWSQVIGTRLS